MIQVARVAEGSGVRQFPRTSELVGSKRLFERKERLRRGAGGFIRGRDRTHKLVTENHDFEFAGLLLSSHQQPEQARRSRYRIEARVIVCSTEPAGAASGLARRPPPRAGRSPSTSVIAFRRANSSNIVSVPRRSRAETERSARKRGGGFGEENVDSPGAVSCGEGGTFGTPADRRHCCS
jgi:hypothetical protein